MAMEITWITVTAIFLCVPQIIQKNRSYDKNLKTFSYITVYLAI